MLRRLRKKAKRAVRNLVSAMHDKPLAPPSESEQRLVKELLAALQSLETDPAKRSGPAENEWHDNVLRLKELVARDDPRRFLRWDVIQKTMFVAQADYVEPELQYLQNRPDWPERWSRVIEELPAGHPAPYWRYPQSSGNCIHHAYHWARFEETTGLLVKDMDFLFEFGGGYGSMCRLAHRLGFHGRYLLYDLPPYSALQEFYLHMTAVNTVSPASFLKGQPGVACICEPQVLKDVLSHPDCASRGLFVATWSLSESPADLRDVVLELVHSFQGFLIAYQASFSGVDNLQFFHEWCLRQTAVEWHHTRLEHLPGDSKYLMGRRRSSHRHIVTGACDEDGIP